MYVILNNIYLIFLDYWVKKEINLFIPPYGHWYLMSLILWRLTINFFGKQYGCVIISIIVSLLTGYWKLPKELSISKTVSYYSFFLIGYKLSTQQLQKILNFRKGLLKFLIFFIFFIIYLFKLFKIANSKENYSGIIGFGTYNNYNTIFKRIIIYVIVFFMILFNLLLLPNFKIPIITTIGCNTLYIYLFHDYFVITLHFKRYYFLLSFFCTLLIVIVLGSNFVRKYLNLFFDFLHQNILLDNNKGKIIILMITLSYIFILIYPIFKNN